MAQFNILNPAGNAELMELCYRLRYQSYFVHDAIPGFDADIPNPDGTEHDKYDERAQHRLVMDITTGTPVGYVRLVPYCGHQDRFPFCAALASPTSPVFVDYVECSRFIVVPAYRGSREALIAIVRAALDGTRVLRGTGVYAAMEPGLRALLAKIGIGFYPAIDVADYYGVTTIYETTIREMLAECKMKRFEVWQALTNHGGNK